MDCNVKKEDLLTFFYGECEEGEQERMKEHVATCAVCRRELDALARTQALLRAWPDEAPRLDLTFVEAEVPRRRFRLMAGLAAAAVATVVLFLAWPEFELSYRAGELDLKWGEALVDEPPTRTEVLATQESTLASVNQLLRASEMRQQRVLDHLLTEIQAQRYRDLQLIFFFFEKLYSEIYIHLRRNEAPVLELLPATRYTNP
ncbi:MAG: hypothetical protein F4105_10945 [Gemmatimonadetes bacterium]|nr:hypothetical protein [Gemmatimonadota bacterium]